ncbi:hypothetical protein DO97_21105 [Neosynechococcus sphagnicola sy1]|uniref:Uncharacterized protein n=1 Tax=Neosynechococcus sphagnicola sy1 TaxID=1497020 RepID=A0A098TR89_9CYAN|nr:hypothetical protein [Neosynechococcus sphagnicola]KGF73318.1 hypothetical protein DO97_21105 [Neosynechococcus sphagnicola sy1]
MMNRIAPIVGIVMVTTVANPVMAQPLFAIRNLFRVGDNQVYRLLDSLEYRTNIFQKSLDTELDHSRLNGSNREDNINAFVKDFERSTDRLARRFRNGQAIATDVQEVFDQAVKIDRLMDRGRFGRAERDWNNVRNDLRELARITYGARYY